jgi:cell division inhibitor SepF
MGSWDKIKKVIGIPDENDYVGEDMAEEEVEELVQEEKIPAKRESYRAAKTSAPATVSSKAQVNMVIIRSNDYSDARNVADHILAHRAVLLNLENCNKDMAQRILDFLSGVVYSQGGDLQRVAHSTYAVTPRNVGLQGELAEESVAEEY